MSQQTGLRNYAYPSMPTPPYTQPGNVQQSTQLGSNYSMQGSQNYQSMASKPLPQVPVVTEKIRLATNSKEREQYDNMADLYSLFVTVERLEKAYVRDSIPADLYTKECTKLIAKFKTLLTLIQSYVPDVEKFMEEYKLECPAAKRRLIVSGVPATVEHGGLHSVDNNPRIIAESVQHFITTMDSLKLNLHAVDQLQPLLNDLVDALHRTSLPEFDGKVKLKNWLIKLNQMNASDELEENQIRQLLFDLESAYSTFHKLLASK